VYEGEVFGFLGPNGAGKTTTIRLLMDLIRPTSGHASIFGMEVRQGGPRLRRDIGYLPGELGLWPNLTGKQILHYLASERGGSKVVDPRYTAQLAERLGLDLGRKFREYSKGNKQKVGLVQAFMHRPRLLILDEPTGGLDPLNQQEFFRMLTETRAEGATVLLSTHILSEVEQTSDRVGIIRDGRLVRVGAIREVVAERSYRVTLTLAIPVTPMELALFEALSGVRDVDAQGRDVSFTVHGAVDPVLKLAARLNVLSITSREPTLEEAFLEYYRPEPGTHTGE
jgi:ABC-2 type transport system ATP-binding protein